MVGLIAIVALVVAAVYVTAVLKTSALNKDPLQHELGHLIIEMMSKGADADARAIFEVSTFRAFMGRFVTDAGEQQTRLAHALSQVRPMLNPEGYARARAILRQL